MSVQERHFPALATLRVFPKETGLPTNLVEFSARERTFISVSLAVHPEGKYAPLVLLQATDVAGVPAAGVQRPGKENDSSGNQVDNVLALMAHLKQKSERPDTLAITSPSELRAQGYVSNHWPGLPDTMLIQMPAQEFQQVFSPELASFPFHLSPDFVLAQLRSLALEQATESIAVGIESNPVSVFASTEPSTFDSSRLSIHRMLEAGYKETETFWMYYLSLVLKAEARQHALTRYPDSSVYWNQNGVWEDWVD